MRFSKCPSRRTENTLKPKPCVHNSPMIDILLAFYTCFSFCNSKNIRDWVELRSVASSVIVVLLRSFLSLCLVLLLDNTRWRSMMTVVFYETFLFAT